MFYGYILLTTWCCVLVVPFLPSFNLIGRYLRSWLDPAGGGSCALVFPADCTTLTFLTLLLVWLFAFDRLWERFRTLVHTKGIWNFPLLISNLVFISSFINSLNGLENKNQYVDCWDAKKNNIMYLSDCENWRIYTK